MVQADDALSLPPNRLVDGQWLQFRRDRGLSGRSPLVGNITCPELLWTLDLGARKHWLLMEPSASSSQLVLPSSGSSGNAYALRNAHQVQGEFIDLNDDGSQLWSPNEHGRWKIGDFREAPGYERIVCHPGWGNVQNRCYLQNWDGSQWQEVWHTDLSHFESDAAGSRPIVGDFDNDGQAEIALLAWYQMHLVDLATGAHETSGEFWPPDAEGATTGRAYGWFGAANLDDDPRHEFVILGDFEHFIAVFDWEGDALSLRWDKRLPRGGLNDAYVRLHSGINPLADIDGDGHADIVTSVFNENEDERWHVLAFNASGEQILDIASAYLSGLGDLDQDGVSELLVTATETYGVPDQGGAKVLSYQGGVLTELWSGESEGFETHNLPSVPDSVNPGNTHYLRTAVVRENWGAAPFFITRSIVDQGPDVHLRLYQWSGNGLIEAASLTGPRLSVLQWLEDGPNAGLLVQSVTETTEEGPVAMEGMAGTLQLSARVASGDGPRASSFTLLTSTVGGHQNASAAPVVITQDYRMNMRAYRADTGTPELQWRSPGRGMTSGGYGREISSVNAFNSVVLADIAGTGDLAAVFSGKAENGAALMKAIDKDGNTLWQSQLPAAGAPTIWNDSGISHWSAGHFRDSGREDIVVSIRRQTQQNYELHLLDGLTGELVWTRRQGGIFYCGGPNVGAGAVYLTIFDQDGDGLDDILDMSNRTFAVYRGSNGALILNRSTQAGQCAQLDPIFNQEVFTYPIVPAVDFDNDGEPWLMHGKNEVTLALLKKNGDRIWNTPFHSGLPFNALQGVADLDDDGVLEIVSAGACESGESALRVHESVDGAVRWTLAMPPGDDCGWPGPKAMASVDLDSNGTDEVLVMSGNGLLAAGEINGQGTWLWRVQLGSGWTEYGYPVIADIHGNGRPTVLINSPDGYLFALGSTATDSAFQINAGLNDAWVRQGAPYQGMFLTVYPQLGLVFVAWFTFDSVPPDSGVATFGARDHRWVTAVGTFEGSRATLKAELTSGGRFNASEPQAIQDPTFGTIEIDFTGCNHAWVEAKFPSADISQQFEISRVVGSNIALCEALAGDP